MIIKLIKFIKNLKSRRIILAIAIFVIAFLGPTVYMLTRHPSQTSAAWFNSSWLYRKAINIANSSGGALANFQVSFTVDTTDTTKFQTDCDDIRVTDANGKLLPHWVEESGSGACGQSATKVWTKVPSLPTSGQTIYLYYGNSSATSVASGDNVFVQFDTFNQLDQSKWNVSGSPTVTGGSVSLSSSASLVSKSTVTDSSGLGNLIFRAEQAATTVTGAKIGFSNSSTNAHYHADDSAALTAGSTEEQVSQTANSNLVSHHQLEETTTTDANQFKASGYLDTGKLSQAVSIYGNAAGTVGSTLTFNRGAQISGNNYEHINSNQGTISFWVKSPTAIGSITYDQYLFDFGDAAGNRIALYMDASEDDLTLNINGTETSSAGITFAANTYYLITFTYNFTADTYDVYQNGVNKITSTTAFTAPTPAVRNFIGSNYSSLLQAQGLIDDFAIFDRLLTTTEITAIAAGVEAGSVADPSLKFYAKMDGTGTLSPVTYNGAASASKMTSKSTELAGGTNLLADGDMEDGNLNQWAVQGGQGVDLTVTKNTDNLVFDTQNIKIERVGITLGAGVIQTFTVSPNTTYYFSGWRKDAVGTGRWLFRDTANADNFLTLQGATATDWTRYETSFKTASNATTILIYMYPGGSIGDISYFDNLSVTPNLVDNGGMEGTYTGGLAPGWGEYDPNSVGTPASDTGRTGTYSQKYTWDNGAWYYSGLSRSLTGLTTGNWYLLSFWYKTTATGSNKFLLDLSNSTPFAAGSPSLAGSTSFTKYSKIMKATGTGGVVYFFVGHGASLNDSIWIDDVSVIPLDNTALSFKAWTPVNDTPGGNSTELLTNTGFETAGTGGADVFGSWAETAGDGAISDELSVVHNGSHAAKLTGGATPYPSPEIRQNYSATVGKTYTFTFWTRGDGTNAGRYYVWDNQNGTWLVALSSGVSSTSYTKTSVSFSIPTGCLTVQVGFRGPSVNGGYAYFDDVSIKEVNNPLSVHGSSTGVGSTSPGARNNAYKFDGSTGYLRQKTYAMNIGTLSYLGNDTTTAELSDDGQTFTSYQTASGTAYSYMIVVTNSDNTTSWGYLGASDTANHINIHTAKGSATRGWNGTAPVAGTKTPIGYEIRKTDYQITGNITVGAWVKRSSAGTHMILSKYNYMEDGTTQCSYGLRWNSDNTIRLYANDAYNGTDSIATTATIASDGIWHYVVGVINSTNTSAHIYIDGSLSTESTSWNSSIYDSPIPLVVGIRYYSRSPIDWFSGSIDSPFVISSALTLDQIKDIYNSTASHYGLTTNNATVNTQPANSTNPSNLSNTYSNYQLAASSSQTVLSQDGTTIATSTTNLPNSAMYVRLQNADTANTLTVDWLAVTKYAATTPSAVVSETEEQSQGPVAYWKFDEGTGTTANDSTQNKNTGSLGTGSSAPSWQTEDMCVSGKCLKFDGVNDNINAGSGNTLNFGTGNFTISMWIKLTADNINNKFLAKYQDDTNRMYLATQASGYLYYYSVTGGVGNGTVTGTTDIRDRKWHYVVLRVVKGTASYFYLDGKLDGTGSAPAGNYDNTGNLHIGDYSNSLFFNGFIDEVKIYPYARSAAQIKADYNSGKAHAASSEGVAASLGSNLDSSGALSEGLVGYWKMDEASGNGAADSSGNSLTGSVTAGTVISSGKFGNTRDFNATNTEAVTVSDNDILEINSTTSYSGFAWIKPDSVSTYYSIFHKRHGGCSEGFNFNLKTDATIQLYMVENSANYITSSTATVTTTDWAFVGFTIDRNTKKATIYINGQTSGAPVDITNMADMTNACPMYIAAWGPLGNGYFDGKIDDVRIYNRALSPSEVEDLYQWAPGPVAYYNFEEGSGASLNDKSGNNNNSTGWNSDPEWTQGKYGKALKFDGNDSVDITDSVSLSPQYGLTVESWVKFDQLISYAGIAAKSSNSTSGNSWFLIIDNNLDWKFGVYDTDNCSGWSCGAAGMTTLTETNGPSTNTWYYVAGTYQYLTDGTSKMRLYIDGVLVKSTDTACGPIVDNAQKFEVGEWASSEIIGSLDDVKIYNYARTNKQIVEDMNAGHPAVGSPVGSAVGYWKFDEGYGTTANNSGNGGSALNGTFGASTAAPAWNQNGKFGKALGFDGGDYVDVGAPASLDSTKYTFSLWFKTGATSPDDTTGQRIIAIARVSASTRITLMMRNNKPEILWFDLGGNVKELSTNTIANDNTWHHLVGTTDETNFVIYLDGIQKNSVVSSFRTSGGYYNVSIGTLAGSTAYFNGLIDEVKIYNYALTEDEVKTEYNRGSAMVLGSLSDTSGLSGGQVASQSASAEYCIPGDTATCNAPVGRWSFDTGSGSSVPDETGNGNTGTWNGTGSHWTTGKIGKAGKFNGSNDKVTFTGVAVGTTHTISMWIYPIPSSDSYGTLFSQESSTGIWYRGASRKISYYYSGASHENNTALTENQWHHINIVTSGGSVTFYIDGTADGTASSAVGYTANNMGDDTSSETFKGRIDETKVFNYARSPAQIAWDYNRGKPVAQYKFDECQGGIAYDSAADPASGGTREDGTITIGATGTQTQLGTCSVGVGSTAAWGNGSVGKYNSSLNFDGVDDYVSVANASNLNPTTGISVAAWFKTTDTGGGLVVKRSGVNGYRLVFANTGILYFTIGNGSTIVQPNVSGYGDGNWHQAIGTWSNTDNTARLYIDGSLKDSGTISGPMTNTATALLIGNSDDQGLLNGQIDDVQVFNYALTSQQVKTLFNQGSAVRFGPVSGIPD